MAPLCGGALLFYRFLPTNGLLGHDYSHYFTRLLIGADHFWKNGFRIPHFTPYLCGGVPFHADPQQIYYSLPQLLAFFWEVLPATYFSFAVFYILGYWGMWKLCKTVFSFENRICHFVALLFLLNGFSFNHLFVGHITHMPFLLAPWFLYFAFKRNLILFSLIPIYCIYSGALHVLVVFGMMFLVFLPLLIRGKEFLWFGLTAPLLILLCCAGKLYASFRFAPLFFMHKIDSLGEGSLYDQVVRYFWLDPFSSPTHLPFGDWSFGSWEFSASISRITMVLAAIGILCAFRRIKTNALILLSTFTLVVLVVAISRGSSLNESLPFFSHYHNPLKVLGALIVPIFLLSGFALQSLSAEIPIRDSVFLGLGVLLLAEFFATSEFVVRTPNALGFPNPGAEFHRIRREAGLPPVTQAIRGGKDDYSAIKAGQTNLACYEPHFGYRRETLQTKVTVGSRELNHPGCLLYPNELGCKPWDLAEDPMPAALFAHGLTVSKWVPKTQRVLDWVSLFALLSLGFPFAFLLSLAGSIKRDPVKTPNGD